MNTSDNTGHTDMTPKNENSLPDSSLNTVSSSNNSLNKLSTEVTNPSKKALSYIFKLDATKRKLEGINKKIEKLADKSVELDAMIKEKHRVYVVLEKHYYKINIKYQEILSAFHQNLSLHGIDNINIITNQHQHDAFLEKISNSKEKKQMSEILDSLYISFLNTTVQQSVSQDIHQKMTDLQKEIIDLRKQFDDNQDLLTEAYKQFDDVDKEGLLKSYEFSGPKVSLQDFVADPQIEDQLKNLISLYNDKNEFLKFGVKLPKGILLVGKPETGKTFAAKVFASEIDHKMYHIKAHDLFSEDVIDPNEMLYVIFYTIIDHVQKTKESCIIFLDEIEKIISSMGQYSPAAEKMISNTIIKNIINIQKSGLDIIILAALSDKNQLDERFLKYGLFDNQFFLELPKEDERKRLFQLYIQKAEKRAKLKLFDPEILDELVKKTDGFSAEYIKQLISVCVRKYGYEYIQKKPSFAIDKDFIGTIIKTIDSQRNIPVSKSILSGNDRKKILTPLISKHTMKNVIFGELDGQKKNNLIKYIVDNTETYLESELDQLIEMCADEYQKRKSNYHRQSLIQKDFVLEKIQELRDEDKRKGNRSYFSNK